MRFLTCIDSEKGTSTLYEVINGKPVAIKVHPLAIETESNEVETKIKEA